MYVAVKGGEKAIAGAHALLAEKRRGDTAVPEIGTDQIREQLALAVDRIMAEGSLYDRETAALAVKQARGDLVEAVFLVRAYRTTLPRFGSADPLDTEAMRVRRRVSATYKDVPGGQVLGPTFDYTHRLLDPALAASGNGLPEAPENIPADNAAEHASDTPAGIPKVLSFLEKEGLLPEEKDSGTAPGDLTRESLQLPAGRDIRLQNLARGDEGVLLALAYSTQRGFGSTHPFAGEIRMGEVEVSFIPEELGFPVTVGEITVTECETVNKFTGGGGVPASFTRGYGLTFGEGERKAMSMALVDRSLRAEELGEAIKGPAQDAEFVLYHSDNVEASGFVQHLKLPHYVDFQAELELVRSLRRAHAENAARDAAQEKTHVR
ncbi:carbon-phosphorus lyase complex subunit [uncultured delta proteobacterium]|uniref:Carbon-phosphorus lyase complex subunit n=1 Tax=uncultured delta proteobacterium TaxID=34034 RepID=A0A212K6G7_9DELT|nr:carbon-phosphorus lyase complex subunit [uncultured delta proteobacterium]